MDLMRLDHAVPNAATCRSLELGVIRCMDEIMEQVRRNTGLSVTDAQIERVLNGKSCSMPQEVVSIITHQGRRYIEKILSAITEAGFDLRAVPSVFIGGGAAILKHRVTAQDRLCPMLMLPGITDCGADENTVSCPAFSFCLNQQNSEHQRAWKIL